MAAAEGRRCVLGVDVGGTKIACGAVDERGAVLRLSEVGAPADDQEGMVDAIVGIIEETRSRCAADGFEVAAVGIGAAGYILSDEGVILEAPNIVWRMVPLRRIAAERTGLPVFLDNDANAAARGERLAGVARGVDDFVLLTLGTGIGGAICVGGRVYTGRRGTAAEMGHMVVEPSGTPCGCGQRGCLEAMASGTALEREGRRAMASDPGSLLAQMCGGDPDRLTGRMVSEAAGRGDSAARRAFESMTFYLGLGVVNLIHIFDPELVVLGGGVSRSGQALVDNVRRVVAERGVAALVAGTEVVLTGLETNSGVVGAAALAWEGIGALP